MERYTFELLQILLQSTSGWCEAPNSILPLDHLKKSLQTCKSLLFSQLGAIEVCLALRLHSLPTQGARGWNWNRQLMFFCALSFWSPGPRAWKPGKKLLCSYSEYVALRLPRPPRMAESTEEQVMWENMEKSMGVLWQIHNTLKNAPFCVYCLTRQASLMK